MIFEIFNFHPCFIVFSLYVYVWRRLGLGLKGVYVLS